MSSMSSDARIAASMTRTLADMTPAERQACVGMWCDNLASTAKVPTPVVLACVQGEKCWILHTNIHGEPSCFSLESVTPRADMPRAWNPDGTPPHGEWVDAEKPATDLLEAMWEAADEGANAAIDAGDTDAANRAITLCGLPISQWFTRCAACDPHHDHDTH